MYPLFFGFSVVHVCHESVGKGLDTAYASLATLLMPLCMLIQDTVRTSDACQESLVVVVQRKGEGSVASVCVGWCHRFAGARHLLRRAYVREGRENIQHGRVPFPWPANNAIVMTACLPHLSRCRARPFCLGFLLAQDFSDRVFMVVLYCVCLLLLRFYVKHLGSGPAQYGMEKVFARFWYQSKMHEDNKVGMNRFSSRGRLVPQPFAHEGERLLCWVSAVLGWATFCTRCR